jgi:hypothetical protein
VLAHRTATYTAHHLAALVDHRDCLSKTNSHSAGIAACVCVYLQHCTREEGNLYDVRLRCGERSGACRVVCEAVRRYQCSRKRLKLHKVHLDRQLSQRWPVYKSFESQCLGCTCRVRRLEVNSDTQP